VRRDVVANNRPVQKFGAAEVGGREVFRQQSGAILPDDVVQVLFAHHHKMIQALLLDCLNEPFHEGVRVRRCYSQFLWPQSFGLQDVPELIRKSGVPVVKHQSLLPIALRQVHCEVPGLLRYPRRIWVRRG
jgi:hypothetical protein